MKLPDSNDFVGRVVRRLAATELNRLDRRVTLLEQDRDRDRSRADLGLGFAHEFAAAKQLPEYQLAFDEAEPLVSIIVATYNRSSLLLKRSVGSLLEQTYENLQIVVVGDHCTDDTFERLASIDDARLELMNLPARGAYPEDPYRRWMVAGTPAMNAGLSLARGRFVTHLDDDDRHPAHRVELLVREAQRRRADLLWHPFRWERDGKWTVASCDTFGPGRVTTSSIFYHSWLARIPWDIDAHYAMEPGDWNRLRKFDWIGAEMSRVDEILLDHYQEGSNA